MNIKRLIKNVKIKTNPEINKVVLNDLINMLDKSKGKYSAEMNVWRIIIKSRMAKFAAAAVIIAAVCLFFINHNRNGRVEAPKIAEISGSKSPAELTSPISLNIAFHRGGMQAVEEQLAEAEKKIRRVSKEHITIEQLLCELDECKEI